jgi:hypothetical protein
MIHSISVQVASFRWVFSANALKVHTGSFSKVTGGSATPARYECVLSEIKLNQIRSALWWMRASTRRA